MPTAKKAPLKGKAFVQKMAAARTASAKTGAAKKVAKVKSAMGRPTSNMNSVAKHIAGGGKVALVKAKGK